MVDPAIPPAPGPLALVGSGEYLPEMAEIEAALLAGRPPRYVQLATAAVPDGPEVVGRWHRLGAAQAVRLGVEAVPLAVATRADAEDPAIVAAVAGAGLIYLSGGKPAYLAQTLRDTPLWAAIVAAWRAGAALAGCSAGAMAMATHVPSLRSGEEAGTPGLGLLPHLQVVPHFDAFFGHHPERLGHLVARCGEGVVLIGVDEMTALVGGPDVWTVRGRASVWLVDADSRREVPAGSTLTVPPGGAARVDLPVL